MKRLHVQASSTDQYPVPQDPTLCRSEYLRHCRSAAPEVFWYSRIAKKYDCAFVDNEMPYGRVPQGHPVIVDYFYHEEIRGTENTGKRNRTCCKASVFCIRYFRNYLYLHSGKRKFSGTFYSRGRRNRLIKSIYLQKCTAPDKLRTVHFFFLQFYNFSIFQTRTSRFQMAINKSLHHHQFNFRLD